MSGSIRRRGDDGKMIGLVSGTGSRIGQPKRGRSQTQRESDHFPDSRWPLTRGSADDAPYPCEGLAAYRLGGLSLIVKLCDPSRTPRESAASPVLVAQWESGVREPAPL